MSGPVVPLANTIGRDEILCRLDDIPDGAARSFKLTDGRQVRNVFLVRRGDTVLCYRNVCPHAGTRLDWVPDKLFDPSGEHLWCQPHGALFEVETGFCIEGPCAGDSLTPLAVQIEADGDVRLME